MSSGTRDNDQWQRGGFRTTADGRSQGDPVGRFQTADGLLKSGRSLAGPLRTGTSPDVGPRAQGVNAVGRDFASDFGMDRVSPREFDPMGTSLQRYRPAGLPADLVTSQVRRGRRDR